MGTALTREESDELARCEADLARYKQAAFDAGRALSTIRDSRLYRQTHSTFEDYCEQKWEFSDRHVRRLIDASDVVSLIQDQSGPTGPVPTNERQVRPLTKLRNEPEKVREAWADAVASSPVGKDGKPKVTAKQVAAAVERVTDPEVLRGRQERSRALKDTDERRSVDIGTELSKASAAVRSALNLLMQADGLADPESRQAVEFGMTGLASVFRDFYNEFHKESEEAPSELATIIQFPFRKEEVS